MFILIIVFLRFNFYVKMLNVYFNYCFLNDLIVILKYLF